MNAGRMNAGARAERYVARLMKRRGFTIIARNFRSKAGEIDLIAARDELLVIMEVRYRRSDEWGRAKDTVTADKQAHIVRCTQDYLRRHPQWKRARVRFDVAGISKKGLFLTCDWVENAFHADMSRGTRQW